MMKPVRLKEMAYEWVKRHPFMTEDVIVGVVQTFPKSSRVYEVDDVYTLSFRRRKNSGSVQVKVWIQETTDELIVLKAHSQGL